MNAIKRVRQGVSEFRSVEAVEKVGWLCVINNVQKKCGENDLSYIPINEKTLALKAGDLMIL